MWASGYTFQSQAIITHFSQPQPPVSKHARSPPEGVPLVPTVPRISKPHISGITTSTRMMSHISHISYLKSAHRRHHDVQQDDIGQQRGSLQVLQGLVTVHGLVDLQSVRGAEERPRHHPYVAGSIRDEINDKQGGQRRPGISHPTTPLCLPCPFPPPQPGLALTFELFKAQYSLAS